MIFVLEGRKFQFRFLSGSHFADDEPGDEVVHNTGGDFDPAPDDDEGDDDVDMRFGFRGPR